MSDGGSALGATGLLGRSRQQQAASKWSERAELRHASPAARHVTACCSCRRRRLLPAHSPHCFPTLCAVPLIDSHCANRVATGAAVGGALGASIGTLHWGAVGAGCSGRRSPLSAMLLHATPNRHSAFTTPAPTCCHRRAVRYLRGLPVQGSRPVQSAVHWPGAAPRQGRRWGSAGFELAARLLLGAVARGWWRRVANEGGACSAPAVHDRRCAGRFAPLIPPASLARCPRRPPSAAPPCSASSSAPAPCCTAAGNPATDAAAAAPGLAAQPPCKLASNAGRRQAGLTGGAQAVEGPAVAEEFSCALGPGCARGRVAKSSSHV